MACVYTELRDAALDVAMVAAGKLQPETPQDPEDRYILSHGLLKNLPAVLHLADTVATKTEAWLPFHHLSFLLQSLPDDLFEHGLWRAVAKAG